MAQAGGMVMVVNSSSFSRCIPTAASQRGVDPSPNHHAAQHNAVLQGLCMRRSGQLKEAGRTGRVAAAHGSWPMPSLRGTPLRCQDEHQASWATERQRGAAMVRASTIGVVREVTPAAKELYYNVVLNVPSRSEVAKWYDTPGKYVDMIPVESQWPKPASFFIASAPVQKVAATESVVLELLIEDVPNTVANELINSKPGDRVVITPGPFSNGFDVDELYPVESYQSVLMFASGYGLAPFRALIETGFEAMQRKHAILYTMFAQNQEPYLDRHAAWEKTGVTIERGFMECSNIQSTDPAQTVVLLVASVKQQEKLAAHFELKGVPPHKILTLFEGIPGAENAYYSKVLQNMNHYPKFPHSGEKHVPIELKT